MDQSTSLCPWLMSCLAGWTETWSLADVTQWLEATNVGKVPSSAKGPVLDLPAGLAVEEIADRVFLITDGDYQAMCADTGDGVVAFDAPPWGLDHLAAIRRVSSAPVTHLVYSHSHYDHIGGAHYLGAPAIVAQSATAEILRRHDDQRRPLPTITFNDELVLQAGRHRVELRYHGPNHQDGNIFIHLPAQQVLMLVDVIVPGWVPFHALGGATDVAGYLGAHDAAVGYDFATLVAGHLTRTGTMHDVHVARQYLHEVRDDCTRARQAVSASAIAAAAGEDKWELASSLFNRLAATAAAELIPRWADRLGGTAAFTQSHCLAMAIALAHEWGIEPAD
jgi:glyoxylase-like metal-dependent hydrolase (beta-lactamase superfamily II)